MPSSRPRSRRASLLSSEVLDRSRILDTLVNNLDGMVYRCLNDENWSMVFVSQGCQRLTGYSADQILQDPGFSWNRITHPEDRGRVSEALGWAIASRQRFAVEYRIITASREVKWILERGVPVLNEQGELVLEGLMEDISQQKAMVESLEQAEERFRHIFENASEGIFQSTREGRYLAANQALARLYRYDSPEQLIDELSDLDQRLYVDPERRNEFLRLMKSSGEVLNFESEILRRDGSRLWISENAHEVWDARGRFVCYEGTVQDISERKHYQEQLERQANHDLLTGLPNRTLLADRLEQGLAQATRLGYYLCVVFIDLDNFKFINDGLGHAVGDLLLKEVAERLGGCLRASDTVARLGGDEFVLVINSHYQVSTVISLLERVLREVNRPVLLDGREFQVGASLGVAMFPDDGRDADSLLKRADIAMYAAKKVGRNNFQFFTEDLNRIANDRLNIEAAMRLALEQDGFEVYYQPKVDGQRRIVGVEALARWFHPELGPVGPDRFIPIAEETGLIQPLTVAILRRAFAAARCWNQDRVEPLRVAVNLSPLLFIGQDLVQRLGDLLDEAQLAANCVEVEITETVFLGDKDRAVKVLEELRTLGVQLAMDDFGTGYSSLSYLRHFPLDVVKIDRSLVTDVESEEEVAMIAGAAISLGKRLRKRVVAEGVENQAQFDFLCEQGCDEFQGFLFSRPVPAAAIDRMLEAGGVLSACG
ncbi:putative bifunctional diguanylate cyclase/phosphodiesterase [Stutzerimonas tarimensis]|uniref:Bifunctional diguanylate cyclase/phosphodiesterase n=1 Tax=Stutzerimonas tarimensis TaxID=1507735 RepID=A0ABV7T9T7_9GAMM